MRSCVALRVLRRRSCAAGACWRNHVAASGGQGGPGGLRFPPRPSLDSPLPLETPPLRYGDGGGGALRFGAALCRRGKWFVCCFAFSRCLAGFAAHPCAACGCGSSLVAASGGQGGIGGLRVPPTPSLDSLLTPLYRRRSAMGMEAAGRCVLTRRAGVGALSMRGCSAVPARLGPHSCRVRGARCVERWCVGRWCVGRWGVGGKSMPRGWEWWEGRFGAAKFLGTGGICALLP